MLFFFFRWPSEYASGSQPPNIYFLPIYTCFLSQPVHPKVPEFPWPVLFSFLLGIHYCPFLTFLFYASYFPTGIPPKCSGFVEGFWFISFPIGPLLVLKSLCHSFFPRLRPTNRGFPAHGGPLSFPLFAAGFYVFLFLPTSFPLLIIICFGLRSFC